MTIPGQKPQSRYKNITAVRRELERAAGWAALKANKQKQSDSYRHSYVIKISGTKRGIGVTHTALSMAYMLAEYGIKCILYEQSGNSDILEVMLNGKLYDNGLLYYKGVWFAADNVSYKMYGSDDTDNVNYKQNNDGNFDSMNFNVMIVEELGEDFFRTPWIDGGKSGCIREAKRNILRSVRNFTGCMGR